jgi:tRNA 2-thiouridine synthesizing protein B
MLHTVNKSPFERVSLDSCLRFAKPNDAILLYEDGVYGALAGTRFESTMAEALKKFQIYVMVPDVEARGMKIDRVIAGIQPVDYAGFVDLVAGNYPVQAWL